MLDTNFAADLTIVEEASELIRRITEKDRPLPQFTSCCPGWVHFAEIYAPEMLPHLSSAKSPIGMQGATVKTYFAQKMGLDAPDGRAIFEAAAAGNARTLAVLNDWISEIAQGLAGLVHIFNPQLILIGGGVSAQQELLIDPLAAQVCKSVMPAFAEGLEIKAAALQNDAGLVGAVYYFRENQ